MTRGRRPKPGHLRLVDGSHRPDRHGTRAAARATVATSAALFGPLVCPKFLRGEAAAAWKQFIAPASWLDGSREPSAIAFCELYGEMRRAPVAFSAARHSQLRAYMSELGLSDERRRPPQREAPDEFFG